MNEGEIMEYTDCPIFCEIKHQSEPIITRVPLDEFTAKAEECFDYDFDGESKVYPYELPEQIKNIDFKMLVITGASGSGKSTLLKEFMKDDRYRTSEYKKYSHDKAIISNFKDPDTAVERLSAVGLNSIPVWVRPRRVLSVGEGFRADVALNIDNYVIFDEWTSTIDRQVAKSTCNGIKRFIDKNKLHNIVFCSCHKDYINYLKPDFVIDLDTEKVYDCRNADLDFQSASASTKPKTKIAGAFLKNIIISQQV